MQNQDEKKNTASYENKYHLLASLFIFYPSVLIKMVFFWQEMRIKVGKKEKNSTKMGNNFHRGNRILTNLTRASRSRKFHPGGRASGLSELQALPSGAQSSSPAGRRRAGRRTMILYLTATARYIQ